MRSQELNEQTLPQADRDCKRHESAVALGENSEPGPSAPLICVRERTPRSAVAIAPRLGWARGEEARLSYTFLYSLPSVPPSLNTNNLAVLSQELGLNR